MNWNLLLLIGLAVGLGVMLPKQLKSTWTFQKLSHFFKTRVSLETLPNWLPFFHSLLLFLTGFLEILFPEHVKALHVFSLVDYPWAYHAGLMLGEYPEAEQKVRIYLILFFAGGIYWFLLGSFLKVIGGTVLRRRG